MAELLDPSEDSQHHSPYQGKRDRLMPGEHVLSETEVRFVGGPLSEDDRRLVKAIQKAAEDARRWFRGGTYR